MITSISQVYHKYNASISQVYHKYITSIPQVYHKYNASIPQVHHKYTTSIPQVYIGSVQRSYPQVIHKQKQQSITCNTAAPVQRLHWWHPAPRLEGWKGSGVSRQQQRARERMATHIYGGTTHSQSEVRSWLNCHACLMLPSPSSATTDRESGRKLSSWTPVAASGMLRCSAPRKLPEGRCQSSSSGSILKPETRVSPSGLHAKCKEGSFNSAMGLFRRAVTVKVRLFQTQKLPLENAATRLSPSGVKVACSIGHCDVAAGYFKSTVLKYWFPFQSTVLKY
jgi:hypothetical protein